MIRRQALAVTVTSLLLVGGGTALAAPSAPTPVQLRDAQQHVRLSQQALNARQVEAERAAEAYNGAVTRAQAAALASISNPYLSQIEHGLALPSISVISALAEALSVSAETMLLRAAGIVSPCTSEGWSISEDAIRHDPRLDEPQKLALLAVLASFVGSSVASPVASPVALPVASSVASSAGSSPDKSARTDKSGPAPSRTSPSKVSRPKIPGRPATAEAVSTRRKRT